MNIPFSNFAFFAERGFLLSFSSSSANLGEDSGLNETCIKYRRQGILYNTAYSVDYDDCKHPLKMHGMQYKKL